MKNIFCHKNSSMKLCCLLAVFAVLFLTPARETGAETIQESEIAIKDSLIGAGINVSSVTVSETNVGIRYQQSILEFTDIDGMLTKIATILAAVSDILTGSYQVEIHQTFDDGQIMEVIGQSEDGQLYLEGSISSAVFQEKLELNPQTRGPMLTSGTCNPSQGDNCQNSPCECYPDETCDPGNPAADEKGCVVKAAPPNSHLSGTQYVCDTGYEWNDALSACVPETTCPPNAVIFQEECHCDDGYEWNADKTQCIISQVSGGDDDSDDSSDYSCFISSIWEKNMHGFTYGHSR